MVFAIIVFVLTLAAETLESVVFPITVTVFVKVIAPVNVAPLERAAETFTGIVVTFVTKPFPLTVTTGMSGYHHQTFLYSRSRCPK